MPSGNRGPAERGPGDETATGCLVTSMDGQVIAADDAFCALVGLPHDAVVGTVAPYPWLPDDNVPWFQREPGSYQGSAPGREHYHGTWTTAAGEPVPVVGRVTAPRGEDGEVLWLVHHVAVTSPSDEKPGVPAAREGHPYELETWLQRMFQSNIVGIITGQEDMVLEANDAFLEMLGYQREEFEQGGINWADITPPEWLDVDAQAGEVMLREGASPAIEKEYFHKDGSRVRVKIAGAVVSRKPFRWISVVDDRTAEREYLDAVRHAVTPSALPQPPGMVVHAWHHGSDEFTGDFYDLFPLPGGAGWGLMLGDVSGHGHQAAGLTALARHTLRGAAIAESGPGRALGVLNMALLDVDIEPSYCTAAFAQLRLAGNVLRVRIARAGHPYPRVVRSNGSVDHIAPHGLPLGLFPNAELQEELVLLDPGDLLVLFTDGLTDNRSGEEIMTEKELDHVLETVAGTSPHGAVEAILDRLNGRFTAPVSDDIAIVTIGAGPR